MARESLILICASLIFTQLVVVESADANNADGIDWSTLHDEFRTLAGGLRKKCLSENAGVTPDMVDGAELGEFDPLLGCYFKCVMERGGVLKKDGKINYKLLTKMMPQAFKHIGLDMLDQCRSIHASDRCEKAMKFNQCMYSANPVAYFSI